MDWECGGRGSRVSSFIPGKSRMKEKMWTSFDIHKDNKGKRKSTFILESEGTIIWVQLDQ